MKSCLRIPRLYLPCRGYEKWAVLACDRMKYDRGYWERVAEYVGDAPSSLYTMLPEVCMEEAEERTEEIRETMYAYLEGGAIEKINRGMVLVERTLQSGTRRGLLCCVDIEEYSYDIGKDCGICATQSVSSARLMPCVKLREQSVLEFPHTVLLYRDKRDKLMRSLEEEELEQLYDFDCMEDGGHLTGQYIPEYIAADLVHDLMQRADPCFVVADGNCSLLAAKTYWDQIKDGLSEVERRNHPARFALAEFVNVSDPMVEFTPVHRLLSDVETETFFDFMTRNCKGTRKGNVLQLPPLDCDGFMAIDALIRRYLKENGGEMRYTSDLQEVLSCGDGDTVGVVFPDVDGESLFAAAKKRKRFPEHSFLLGSESEARYCLEGREISYD